jgi:hypothetical protein
VLFYPQKKGQGTPLHVGRLHCRAGQVESWAIILKDSRSLDLEALRSKLRFLIESTDRNSVEQLLGLRSDFWSFVEVPAEPARGEARADVDAPVWPLLPEGSGKTR